MIQDYLNLPQVQFLIEHWYALPILICAGIGVIWFIDSREPKDNVSRNNILVNSYIHDDPGRSTKVVEGATFNILVFNLKQYTDNGWKITNNYGLTPSGGYYCQIRKKDGT